MPYNKFGGSINKCLAIIFIFSYSHVGGEKIFERQ